MVTPRLWVEHCSIPPSQDAQTVVEAVRLIKAGTRVVVPDLDMATLVLTRLGVGEDERRRLVEFARSQP
jgi:hypothetical protein